MFVDRKTKKQRGDTCPRVQRKKKTKTSRCGRSAAQANLACTMYASRWAPTHSYKRAHTHTHFTAEDELSTHAPSFIAPTYDGRDNIKGQRAHAVRLAACSQLTDWQISNQSLCFSSAGLLSSRTTGRMASDKTASQTSALIRDAPEALLAQRLEYQYSLLSTHW